MSTKICVVNRLPENRSKMKGQLILKLPTRYNLKRRRMAPRDQGYFFYFFSLMQNSVFWPRRNISPAAITGVAMKT
jgi:hypothetical protein